MAVDRLGLNAIFFILSIPSLVAGRLFTFFTPITYFNGGIRSCNVRMFTPFGMRPGLSRKSG